MIVPHARQAEQPVSSDNHADNPLVAEVLDQLEDRLEADRVADMVLEMRRLKTVEGNLRQQIKSIDGRLRASQQVLREIFTLLQALLLTLDGDDSVHTGKLRQQSKQLIEQYGLDAHYQAGLGILLDQQNGKTTFVGDGAPCESRWATCRGGCCTLRFALTPEEVEAGHVQWHPDHPFQIAQGPDGRCVHQDRETGHCTIYENRPAICRNYSCKKDSRIWANYEEVEPGPHLARVLAAERSRTISPDKGWNT
jgi:Fe-S-cluster containining protein